MATATTMTNAAAATASAPTTKQGKTVTQHALPFLFGAVAGCTATLSIQPIDMVKTRLQLSGELGSGPTIRSPVKMASHILKNEGFLAFYSGLSAGLLRQCTYGMSRLGLYRTVTNHVQTDSSRPLPPLQASLIGMVTGATASMVGTPCDLALIRMQSDGTLPKEMRRNYKGVFDALRQIVQQEGVLGLWKGNTPTVGRAMGMNVGMLTTYDESKHRIAKFLESYYASKIDSNHHTLSSSSSPLVSSALVSSSSSSPFSSSSSSSSSNNSSSSSSSSANVRHYNNELQQYKRWVPQLGASMVAGFFAAAFSLPFDFLKTRLQKQKPDPVTGKLPYTGLTDCIIKTAKTEGPFAFYKGFSAFYARVAPHAMITLLTLEALNSQAKKHKIL